MTDELKRVLGYFKNITAIEHCSGNTEKMKEYIADFAERYGCDVEIDKAGNIIARRGDHPDLCLQAHYDMVCTGRAPVVDAYMQDGWLTAGESSLGADNGIGVAMMLAMIEDGTEAEFLFTADEEIGMLGAKELDFTLRASYMINLDAEEAGELYIGCAGGFDMCTLRSANAIPSSDTSYLIRCAGLPGGHSGIDIDKGIPNAIRLMAEFLRRSGCRICSMRGGEKRNSIPSYCEAIVKCRCAPKSEGYISVSKAAYDEDVLTDSEDIIEMLCSFDHGVRSFNNDFCIPQSSANLATVDIDSNRCTVESSLRAMDNETLAALELSTKNFFESYAFKVKISNKYGAWTPEINRFSEKVKEILSKEFGESRYRVIHAGLECGIVKERYPGMDIVSLGPTIKYPHSSREKVDIRTIERIFNVLKMIIRSI